MKVLRGGFRKINLAVRGNLKVSGTTPPTFRQEEAALTERRAYARLRHGQPQLPDRHRIVRAVVVAGDGVEVRQAVPVLVAGTDIQTQQADLLIAIQRLLRR